VELVAVERRLWSGKASFVFARTTVGEIGILPGHEPMLAILAGGEVRVSLPGGEKITATAEDGFLSVQSDAVQVVASRAELT
jgi:F-type H+-transporting ATPase subunit epsilon